MAKLTLTDVGTLANPASAQQALNDNFAAIEAAFENTVSRDGTLPNTMEAEFDANGHKLINVGDPVHNGDAVNLKTLQGVVGNVEDAINSAAAAAISAQEAAESALAASTASFGAFIQSGTGVVARTMQDKARDEYNLLDYMTQAQRNDVRDGLASVDITAALQAALDDVPSQSGTFDVQTEFRGRVINIPAGRFRLTAGVTGKAGTLLRGNGSNSTMLITELTTGDCITFTGIDNGLIDRVGIEGIAVVQKTGVAHAAGYAIKIDGNGFGTTPILRDVLTYGQNKGIYLDWCFPATLEQVHCFAHASDGFTTRLNCTSTTFQNCYAGANGGSGFKIAGHYMSLVGCASDSNTLDGYQFYYDGGASTALAMVGCGTEACSRNGISSDRVSSLSIISQRVIVGAAGVSALKFDGGDAITVASPVLSAVSANANPCIDISNASGLYPGSVHILGWSGTATNYATNINNTDNVYWPGGRAIASLANGVMRLGSATNFTAGQQSMAYGQNFPAQVSGNTYGTNHIPVLTGAVTTLAASYRFKPIINASGQTIARMVAGPIIEAPTVTAGTVTRHEGQRINDQPAGSSADANLVLGDAAVPVGRWSLANLSTRLNLFGAGIQWGTSSGPKDLFGTGTPEGAIAAAVGSTFRRTDGGAATSFYVKESGTGNTGWVAK